MKHKWHKAWYYKWRKYLIYPSRPADLKPFVISLYVLRGVVLFWKFQTFLFRRDMAYHIYECVYFAVWWVFHVITSVEAKRSIQLSRVPERHKNRGEQRLVNIPKQLAFKVCVTLKIPFFWPDGIFFLTIYSS